MYLTKVVGSFSSNLARLSIGIAKKRFEFNVSVVNKRKSGYVLVTENFDAALLF